METVEITESKVKLIRNLSKRLNVSKGDLEDLFQDVSISTVPTEVSLDYTNALVMTMSVFYTLGWDHVEPITSEGRIIAIICSCIGVPLTFLLVLTGAKIMIRQARDLLDFASLKGKKETKMIRMGKLLPFLLVIFLVYIQMSAGLLMILEGHTYIDALYNCVVTIFMIGHGKLYVISMGKENDAKVAGWLIFLFVWIYFGLVLLMSNLMLIFSLKVNSRTTISVNYVEEPSSYNCKTLVNMDLEGSLKSLSIVPDSRDPSNEAIPYFFY